MSIEQTLRGLFEVLIESIGKDMQLRARVEMIVRDFSGAEEPPQFVVRPIEPSPRSPSAKKPRAKALLPAVKPPTEPRLAPSHSSLPDPFELLPQSESALRARLDQLELPSLVEVLLQHSLDPKGTVRRLKTPARVRDHIVSATAARLEKGTAFHLSSAAGA